MSNTEAQDLKWPTLKGMAKKWPVLSEKQRFKAIRQLNRLSESSPPPIEWPSNSLSHEKRIQAFYTTYRLHATDPALREILYRYFHVQMKNEQMSPEIIRYTARSIFLKSQASNALWVKILYRKALKTQQNDGDWSGQIDPQWPITLQELERTLNTLLESGSCRTLKKSNQGGVYAGTLHGQDVVIKVFEPKQKKWKDRWRASRARKSWAASVTMQAMGIKTPKALAYLESKSAPAKSYFITEAIPLAVSTRAWVKPRLHRESVAFQHTFRNQLLHSLIDLYEVGLYHGDTKLGNLLVTQAESPADRSFYWIDLDSVIPAKASAPQIMRNLVQLNGSTGRGLAPMQRQAFLNDLALLYPWVASPKTWRRIEKITRKRLLRELQRICGH